ncbi:MAG: FAD-dependent oxidoreductase, partial [Verrucomicrobia bacterium]|nr:FAD-dependent oxidoreductase [Verrucomicrobiota bacterium]
PRAIVARMAGAQFAPYPAGEQTFQRVIVGGEVKEAPCITGRKLGLTFRAAAAVTKKTEKAELIEYTLRLPMRDDSFTSFAEAEQKARDLTFHPEQLDEAESLFQVPPDPIRAVKPAAGAWTGAAALDLDAFRPVNVPRMFVLGGCADVPRDQAAKLLRPLALIDMGTRIGVAAAVEAKTIDGVKAPKVADAVGRPGESAGGDVKEILVGVRPTQRNLPTVPSPKRSVPVLGRYDVVVIGGGTGGAPAGIGAARGGAKTLVVEHLHGLGGVGTMGRISKYYHGYRGGFTAQVDAGIKELGASDFVVGKTEWWRQANRRAGANIWFGVLGCGALVEKDVVKGVVVATPQGRGIVLAKTVIDSTGNSDIAAAAGAQTIYTGGDEASVQGTGLPPLNLGAGYTNTDYTFADDTDVVDFWHHYIVAKHKFRGAYDLGQLVDSRERRRIVGDVTLTPMDIILSRTWPDTMNIAQSNFDTHGFTVHPTFYAMPPDRKSITAYVPLRALLPKGLDGILVTGLGVSAHRDAMPIIRMQPDVQNQGYAC